MILDHEHQVVLNRLALHALDGQQMGRSISGGAVFGERRYSVMLWDSFEQRPPRIIVQTDDWRLAFTVPKDWPKTYTITGNLNLWDLDFQGDDRSFAADIVYLKMSL